MSYRLKQGTLEYYQIVEELQRSLWVLIAGFTFRRLAQCLALFWKQTNSQVFLRFIKQFQFQLAYKLISFMYNKCELVRRTCSYVYERAKHVKINEQNLKRLVEQFSYKQFNDDACHHTQKQPQRALLQLFILDCMNFCFWPIQNFQYEQLATHIQKVVKEGIQLQDLSIFKQEDVVSKLFHGLNVPLADQRARILRQMSNTVLNRFQGSFVNIINLADKSAVSLLNILTSNFSNFQDHSIYEGHQIHFYKRAQILIGDIYGKFNGSGLGEFKDINELTMFPDYRVPQILQAENVFIYSQYLRKIIHSKTQITDRHLQAQLRACSIVAIELMKDHLHNLGKKEVLSCEIDWFLWQLGESRLAKLQPHHRCLTIYY